MSNEQQESEVALEEISEPEATPAPSPATISKRDEYTSYALLFGIHVLMALFFVISRWGLSSTSDKVNPNVFSTLRLGFACLIVTPIMKFWLKDLSIPVKPILNPTLRQLVAISIFGGLIPIICFSIGVSLSSAINAAIIAVCQPVLTAAIGIASGVDEFMARKIVGIVISISGALFMLDLQNFKLDGATLGNVLLLTQQCAIAVYNVLNRNLIATSGLHYGVITAWTLIFGSIMVAVATLPFTLHAAYWHITWKGWLVIAYASGFAATLYFGFSYVLKRIKPTVFSSFITLQPLLTSILAYLFLDESFGWHQLIGAVLVILGLFVVISNIDFAALLGTKSQTPVASPSTTSTNRTEIPKDQLTVVIADTD